MKMEYVQGDIHICGGCRSEFSDIEKFICHKRRCVLVRSGKVLPKTLQTPQSQGCSSVYSRSEQQLSSLSMHNDSLYVVAKSSSLELRAGDAEAIHYDSGQYKIDTAFSEGDALKEISNQSSLPNLSSAEWLRFSSSMPSASQNSQVLSHNVHAWPQKECSLPETMLPHEHLYVSQVTPVAGEKIMADDTLSQSGKVVPGCLHHSSEESQGTSSKDHPDIDVYVVDSQTFGTKSQSQQNVNVQTQCHEAEHKRLPWPATSASTDEPGCTLESFSAMNYKHLGYIDETPSVASAHHLAPNHEISNSLYIDEASDQTESISQEQVVNANGLHVCEKDTGSYSDSSTPCPEDLEVGQISAAMAGQENQQHSLKTLLGVNRQLKQKLPPCNPSEAEISGISFLPNSSISMDVNFHVPQSNLTCYIRENTASAPITKTDTQVESKTETKKTLEKRERLRGVSDDLLSSASPCMSDDSVSNTRDMEGSAAVSARKNAMRSFSKGSQQETLGDNEDCVSDSSVVLPTLRGYKAVFTSPSSAGHRLAPRQLCDPSMTDLLTSPNANCQISKGSLFTESSLTGQSSMEFKDISASVKMKDDRVSPGSKLKNSSVVKKKALRRLIFRDDPEQESSHNVTERPVQFSSPQDSCHRKKDLNSLAGRNDNDSLTTATFSCSHFASPQVSSKICPSNFSSENSGSTESKLNEENMCSLPVSESPGASLPLVDHQPGIIVSQTDQSTAEAPREHFPNVLSAADAHIPAGTSSDPNTVIMVYRQGGGNFVVIPDDTCQLPMSGSEHGSVLQRTKNLLLQPDTEAARVNIQEQINAQTVVKLQSAADQIPSSVDMKIWPTQDSAAPISHTLPPSLAGLQSTEKEKYIMKPRAKKVSNSARQQKSGSLSQSRSVLALSSEATPVRVNSDDVTAPRSTQAGLTQLAAKGSGANNSSQPADKKTPPKYRCEYEKCSYTTSLYKDIMRHQRTHTGERPFTCKDCGKKFNRSDKLKIHLRGHSGLKPFQCSVCDYASVESGSLKKHMRIHTDERPFKCQICPYASRNSSQLIVHLRTHTGDSPFHCTMCSAQFKINSDLKRHLRIHTGEKPFPCDKCDYKSTNKGNLKTHYKINHSKDNEKSCPKCEFTTSSAKRFREHMKTHDSKRVVRCTRCEYTCTSLTALRNHMSIHNPVRPFQCHVCSYSSKQRGNLKKHIQNLHLDKFKSGVHGKNFSTSEPVPRPNTEQVKKQRSSNQEQIVECGRTRRSTNYRKMHQCEECGSRFVREDSLRCHMKQHSGKQEEVTSTNREQTECVSENRQLFSSLPLTRVSSGSVEQSVQVRQGMHHIAAAASKAFQEQFIGGGGRENSPEQLEVVADVDCSTTTTTSSLHYRDKSDSLRSMGHACTTTRVTPHPIAPSRVKRSSAILESHGQVKKESLDAPALSSLNSVDTKGQPPWEHRSYTLSSTDASANTGKSSNRLSSRRLERRLQNVATGNSANGPSVSTDSLRENASSAKLPHTKTSSSKSRRNAKRQKVQNSTPTLLPQTVPGGVTEQTREISGSRQVVSAEFLLHQGTDTSQPAAATAELLPGPCGESIMLLSHQEVKGEDPAAYNLQLVPQVSGGAPASNSDILALTQELIRHLGLAQPTPPPATHIQIVLPGAAVPNPGQVMGTNQGYMSAPQQILLQVQDSSGQPQEIIALPMERGSNSTLISGQTATFSQQPQSHVSQMTMNQGILCQGQMPMNQTIVQGGQMTMSNHTGQLAMKPSLSHNGFVGGSELQLISTNQNVVLQAPPNQLTAMRGVTAQQCLGSASVGSGAGSASNVFTEGQVSLSQSEQGGEGESSSANLTVYNSGAATQHVYLSNAQLTSNETPHPQTRTLTSANSLSHASFTVCESEPLQTTHTSQAGILYQHQVPSYMSAQNSAAVVQQPPRDNNSNNVSNNVATVARLSQGAAVMQTLGEAVVPTSLVPIQHGVQPPALHNMVMLSGEFPSSTAPLQTTSQPSAVTPGYLSSVLPDVPGQEQTLAQGSDGVPVPLQEVIVHLQQTSGTQGTLED
ncbi:uncharacterized protein LOC101850925 [Aplysia californica]|uniref:Uncharacterized protein LOC101850925 n=1 Tax=Aplysia californica TaxID=6500 RepID=A0ABM0JCB4_APLCA|nr:uncharacterized protein LOC101850925 [Aplysia californica]